MPHPFVGGSADSRGPEVAWEAMEETEAASPLVDPGAALEEEMPSTELETGNIPVCAVETRTSPGEDNAASQCKVPKPKGFLLPPLGGD